jgi:aspartyl-tRNA(Asn)/glutamyl-tRNA(Gln) amidotransferase subunit C
MPTAKKKHMNVDTIAALARIQLTDKDREHFAEQLEKVLDYVDLLQRVDVEGIEPSSHAFEEENVSYLREDAIESSFSQEVALQNAPDKQDGQFRVPKVVDDSL